MKKLLIFLLLLLCTVLPAWSIEGPSLGGVRVVREDNGESTNQLAVGFTVTVGQTNLHLTASKIVLTGPNQELLSSAFGESDLSSFVTSAVTNGLATINYVDNSVNFASNVLVGLIISSTNGLQRALQFDANQFTIVNGTNVAIKSGAWVTNLNTFNLTNQGWANFSGPVTNWDSVFFGDLGYSIDNLGAFLLESGFFQGKIGSDILTWFIKSSGAFYFGNDGEFGGQIGDPGYVNWKIAADGSGYLGGANISYDVAGTIGDTPATGWHINLDGSAAFGGNLLTISAGGQISSTAWSIDPAGNGALGGNQLTFDAGGDLNGNDLLFRSLHLSAALTNDAWTASTLLKADANKAAVSIPNGLGAYTNNGSGVGGYFNGFLTSSATNAFADKVDELNGVATNLSLYGSTTTTVPATIGLAGGHNTNAITISQGPAIVGGFDSNGIAFMQISNSATMYLGAYRVFNQTADGSCTNITTTETSWFGTGTGSLTLPAGFWQVGRTLQVFLKGLIWTPAAPGNTAIRVKLGSTVIATNTSVTLVGSHVGETLEVELLLTCRTNSSTVGYIEAEGRITTPSSAGGLQSGIRGLKSTIPIFDTTVALALDVVSTNGASTTSFKIKTALVSLFP